MRFSHAPLDNTYTTQPFGTNWAPDDLYHKFGMLGHNGLDFRASNGTPVYAVADGILEYEKETENFNNPNGYGINARLWVDGVDVQYEVIYGHLKEVVAPNGLVRAGTLIAYSDTTGAATGPHLHFGVRRWNVGPSGRTSVQDYSNGYFGWVDPAPYLPQAPEFPVDVRYSEPRSLGRELAFKPSKLWFRMKTKREMTEREETAFVYGYWPYEAIIDPAMYVVWREMTFPAYSKLLGRKPEEIAKGLRGY